MPIGTKLNRRNEKKNALPVSSAVFFFHGITHWGNIAVFRSINNEGFLHESVQSSEGEWRSLINL